MNDFLGKELKVGDNVIYLVHTRTSSYYLKCKVDGFTPKKVRISVGTCVAPYKLIKCEE